MLKKVYGKQWLSLLFIPQPLNWSPQRRTMRLVSSVPFQRNSYGNKHTNIPYFTQCQCTVHSLVPFFFFHLELHFRACLIIPKPRNIMKMFFKIELALCGSVGWASSCKAKGYQLDSQSGHMPGLWVQSLVGATDRCFFLISLFLSLFFSLPFLLSENK